MSDQIMRTIIVKADVEKAYQVWENFENFPLFMKNIESVKRSGDGTSRWAMKGPLGKKVEWTAEVTRHDLNKRIGWSTKDHDGDITTSGQVTFNQLPQNETEVTVTMQYEPKGGAITGAVAGALTNPEKQLEEDLQNFKKHIEGMSSRTAMG